MSAVSSNSPANSAEAPCVNHAPVYPTPMDHDLPTTPGTIRTRYGRYIDLLAPDPDTIDIADIAHALAHVCRFGGHLPSFYSVAEHSMHVSVQIWRMTGAADLALFGLLHDATEAYLGDMVRPLKQQMPGYREAEARMARAIERRFALPEGALDHPQVKLIDSELLAWEMAMVRDCEFRQPSDPREVVAAFRREFHSLFDAQPSSLEVDRG